MNVYCVICKREMEIIEDLGTELKVYPCKCHTQENTAQPLTQADGSCFCGYELSNGVCPNPACEFNDI